jgi:hypothetical protein
MTCPSCAATVLRKSDPSRVEPRATEPRIDATVATMKRTPTTLAVLLSGSIFFAPSYF